MKKEEDESETAKNKINLVDKFIDSPLSVRKAGFLL